MALNILKQPFIRLSYAQGANTYFYDSTQSKYGKLVATTASDAHFTEVSQTPTDGNVIPDSATVFVTFQDNSTLIVNNFNFYGKPQSDGSTDTIKLIMGTLPSDSNDQEYNIGDVVLAVSLSGDTTSYQLGVCTDVDEVENSGTYIYSYTWSILLPEEAPSVGNVIKVVSQLPNTDSDGTYNFGDVVAMVSTYLDSGRPVFSGFKLYVLSDISQYYDCGRQGIYYTWTEVYTYPQTATTNSSFS